jgi:hypothetical protein
MAHIKDPELYPGDARTPQQAVEDGALEVQEAISILSPLEANMLIPASNGVIDLEVAHLSDISDRISDAKMMLDHAIDYFEEAKGL